MKIYRSLADVPLQRNSVVSIGTFDGVHRAHKQIIDIVVTEAHRFEGRSVLVTFDPHPREIVGSNGRIELLSTLDEKLELFEQYGIDAVFIIPFTYDFSRLSPEEFYLQYIVNGTGVRKVVEGNNHHLGRDREGGMALIGAIGKRNGFDVETVDLISAGDSAISSSTIRRMLHDGSIARANGLLGRPYEFSGTVVKGFGRGKKMGYPTANVRLDDARKLVPKIGVYAVRFLVHGTWHGGMMSIGYNPTFPEHHDRTTEVNIFDFDEDIYDEHVSVRCFERTRDEKKFDSVEALIEAMGIDKTTTQTILKQIP